VIERLLARERWLLLAGVAVVTAVAWLDLWRRARGAMDMAMPEMEPWAPADLGAIVVMWVVMMVAMMLPSAAPMLLLFAGMQRARGAGGPLSPVGAFAAGYLLAWAGFSVAAAVVQAYLQQTMRLSSDLAATSARLGAGVLVLAGVYQLTPLKQACLLRCRSPLGFLLGHWRDGAAGALGMGWRHGAYCLGCCWALMALLFVGGVMNLAWVAALAVFVLAEKALVRGRWLSWTAGAALIGGGAWLALRAS
jgi:predicted metal-binding membrane protein